jgi:mannose-6-phosphate isomerase
MDASLKRITQTPIVLEPNRVWRFYDGGKMIDRLKGLANPKDSLYPEEWVGSCVQASNPGVHFRKGEGLAVIGTGVPEPIPLKSLIEQFPEEMLGAKHVKTHGSNPALLVKLLDAAIRLIIHAHPSKAFARTHLNDCFGKTEAWFVLETRPEVEDPYVLIAFKDEVSRPRYKEMMLMNNTEEMMRLMHRVPVKAGDVVYVKAGVPHAIGEGIFMVELQEPSDYSIILEQTCPAYTFRQDECYLGLDPDTTLSVIDHRVYSPEEVRRELVIKPKVVRREGESAEVELLGYDTTECFSGHRLEVKKTLSDATQDRGSILIVLDGEGKLVHNHGEIPLKRGVELFLPAAVGNHEFEARSELTIFKALPAQA